MVSWMTCNRMFAVVVVVVVVVVFVDLNAGHISLKDSVSLLSTKALDISTVDVVGMISI